MALPFALAPIPIFSADFLKLKKDTPFQHGFYVYNGCRVRYFEITGTIVGITTKPTYRLYDVDDHTGTITVFRKLTEKDFPAQNKSQDSDPTLGTVICVRGTVMLYHRTLCLNSIRQVTLDSPDAESEAILHRLYLRQEWSKPLSCENLEFKVLEKVYLHSRDKISAYELTKDLELCSFALKMYPKDPPEFKISGALRSLALCGQLHMCYISETVNIPTLYQDRAFMTPKVTEP